MKKIMVLAGGNDQIALIKSLREKYENVEIILIDYAENPVAKPYADRHLQISTMDQDAVLESTREENADMIIITCGDQPLPIMAYVAEKLNLPCYLSYNQALNLTNKERMKDIMVKNNIPTAKHCVIKDDNYDDIASLKFPLIVKPADCNGSKGVRRVETIEECIKYIQQAQQFSRTHTAIVEEFKEGIEISVDAFINDGKATILMMSQLNKYKVNDATMVIYQSIIPPSLNIGVYEQIESIANKIAQAYNLTYSPLLIQLIVNGDDIAVIEFSARIGGGAKYKTIHEYTGFNILNANIDAMVNKKVSMDIQCEAKCMSRCHLYTIGGVFDKIVGTDKLISENIIDSFTQTVSSGTEVLHPQGSSNRVGSILIKANTPQELHDKIQYAISNIKVLDATGNDIFLRSMYEQ
ncbi:MAG: ATP-grasp domain-containing protein [Alistipes sp.]|nr:ATP-grasp domain-containing protein [Alistipes sp.]